MGVIKGQNLRVMVGDPASSYQNEQIPTCIAASRSCTLHLALDVEDVSTKDSEGDFAKQEPVGINWDVSVESLVTDDTEINAKKTEELEVGKTYVLLFSRTSDATGGQNRGGIDSSVNLAGYAVLNDLSIQAQNRQSSVANAQFQGVGDLFQAPPSIKDWVNSKNYGSYVGIAKVATTGPSYTVAVAEHETYGTTLFLIAHDGICTTPSAESGHVTGITDLGSSYTAANDYDSLKSWVANMGYNMPDVQTDGTYDYQFLPATAIIGATYLGELESI